MACKLRMYMYVMLLQRSERGKPQRGKTHAVHPHGMPVQQACWRKPYMHLQHRHSVYTCMMYMLCIPQELWLHTAQQLRLSILEDVSNPSYFWSECRRLCCGLAVLSNTIPSPTQHRHAASPQQVAHAAGLWITRSDRMFRKRTERDSARFSCDLISCDLCSGDHDRAL